MVRPIEQAPIGLSMEQVAKHAGQEVSMFTACCQSTRYFRPIAQASTNPLTKYNYHCYINYLLNDILLNYVTDNYSVRWLKQKSVPPWQNKNNNKKLLPILVMTCPSNSCFLDVFYVVVTVQKESNLLFKKNFGHRSLKTTTAFAREQCLLYHKVNHLSVGQTRRKMSMVS